jgi:hypothetical protein
MSMHKALNIQGGAKMKRVLTALSVAVATLALPTLPAHAAGSFDGQWYVDAPAAGQVSSSDVTSGCEAVRIPFQVADNRVSGRLQRAPYGTGRVEEGTGSSASPVTGTVQPDGTLTVAWQSYHANGKLSGDKAELTWKGECGPRLATGGRAK